MGRILLIEDDRDIAASVKFSLEKETRFTVKVAYDGPTGLREASTLLPDLILLDLNLPGLNGLDVCRRIRSDRSIASTPIIMLTARVEEADKVSGLELGADDYITKPFSLKELVARVRALLRRTAPHGEGTPVLVSEHIEIDEERRRVLAQGREIDLTRKEFDLLATLMREHGRVMTRNRLLERVWGYDHPGETRTVDVHVRQLRKKLGQPAADGIETVVGVGYRFRERDR